MLSIVEIICSIIGLVGVFSHNTICMVIGLVIIIICDFIDVFITGHNPITIFFSILLAIGMSLGNKNPLFSFTLALCGENIIITLFVLFPLILSIFKIKEKNNLNDNEVAKHTRLLELLSNLLGVNTLDDIILNTYDFYNDNGIDIPSQLAIIEGLSNEEKYLNLLQMLEIALDVRGIDNIILELEKFYSEINGEKDESIKL